LLALAQEGGDAGSLAEPLERAAAALGDPAVSAVVRSPAIDFRTRIGLVRRIVESLELPSLVVNCLLLLSERERLDIVEDLWRSYRDLLDETLGRKRVMIRSASPLSDAQVTRILAGLRGSLGDVELVAVVSVAPELLGGVVAEVGGVVYDGSLRTEIDRLARQMTAERAG
jgi:F-type H+-transporting ATPase subunit delta